MAKVQKFYAVKKGSVPGIYYSWEECKHSVDGFPGAQYKSFATEKEAEAYMNGTDTVIIPKIDDNTAIAYVDGSFNINTNKAGYGAIIITKDQEHTLSGVAMFNNDLHVKLRQVTGEVCAVLKVVEFCKQNDIQKVQIYYDYAGLAYWANGTWKANNPLSQEYQRIMSDLDIEVEFIKVPAHTNNKYNDMADQAAKNGCKI